MPLPNFFEFYIEELKRQENSSQEGYNPNTETWEPIIAPEWTGSRDNSWAPRKWDIGYGCKINLSGTPIIHLQKMISINY